MVFYDVDGGTSQYPFSRDVAKRRHYKKYNCYLACKICGEKERYTKNDRCVVCSERDAQDFYYYAAGLVTFTKTDPPTSVYSRELTFRVPPDRIVTPEHVHMVEEHAHLIRVAPVSHLVARYPEDALRIGLQHYTKNFPCETAGHLGIFTLNGDCYFCERERNQPSPRQAAKMAGETWYTPTEACRWCGRIAPRRVTNGECKGCIDEAPGTDGRRSESSIMMEAAPDMVISRETARSLGMKVYRTGEPCRRGHTGFRWVSTGGCIDCLKGRKP